MIKFLPLDLITQSFEPQLSEAVQRVVKGGWYLQGEEVAAFEQEFADFIGSRYCIGVGNGLDALTLSLLAMKHLYGWSECDEVIVPNMTFIATAEAVVHAGLKPVMADVDENALLGIEQVEKVFSKHTRVLLPVHLYGHPAKMRELCAWAEENGVYVLEDAAQGHGAVYKGKRVGSWGKVAAFSFYPGKNLGALGDGGAVTTNDADLARLIRVLANYGAEKKYFHSELGFNSRLDEIQAAVLRIKLRRLDEDNNRRRQIAAIYSSHIQNNAVIVPYQGDTEQSVFHIYPIRCAERESLKHYLYEHDVETLIHYPLAVGSQKAIKNLSNCLVADTPHALSWAETELSLPISPVMSETDALYVSDIINRFECTNLGKM